MNTSRRTDHPSDTQRKEKGNFEISRAQAQHTVFKLTTFLRIHAVFNQIPNISKFPEDLGRVADYYTD